MEQRFLCPKYPQMLQSKSQIKCWVVDLRCSLICLICSTGLQMSAPAIVILDNLFVFPHPKWHDILRMCRLRIYRFFCVLPLAISPALWSNHSFVVLGHVVPCGPYSGSEFFSIPTPKNKGILKRSVLVWLRWVFVVPFFKGPFFLVPQKKSEACKVPFQSFRIAGGSNFFALFPEPLQVDYCNSNVCPNWKNTHLKFRNQLYNL